MILSRLERRPRNVLTEDAWAKGMIWGDLRSFTGRDVTPAEALRLTTVYACVSLIAEDIGALPFDLLRKLLRGREEVPNHPLARTLVDPNPEMTGQELWESAVGHLALRGNSYANIVPTRGGGYQLWPLRPDRMMVYRQGPNGGLDYRLDPYAGDSALIYLYTLPSGQQIRLPANEVLHIRGFGGNGVVGYGRIQLAREAVGLALAAEEYGARLFGNGALHRGVLQLAKTLTKDAHDRLRNDFERLHVGLDNAQRIAILEQGTTWQQTGIDPHDAQFLELRQFERTEIAALFRVPPYLVGDVNRSTSWGTGIAEQSVGLVTHTYVPYTTRLERRVKKDLIPDPALYAKLNLAGLLRGDPRSRAEALAIQRDHGVINGNEWREIEDLNPYDGGEEYWRPANFTVVGQPAPPAGPPANPQRAAELAQLLGRMDAIEGRLAMTNGVH